MRAIDIVQTQGDALRSPVLPFVNHQQSGIAFGMRVRVVDHRRGDLAFAVLHQRMAHIGQLRFLVVTMSSQPHIGIGGALVRSIRTRLPVEAGATAIVRAILTALNTQYRLTCRDRCDDICLRVIASGNTRAAEQLLILNRPQASALSGVS